MDKIGRILIIDDDQMNVALFEALLKRDYETISANDGQTGIELFERYRPEVILLDIRMPGMSGLQVCENIRHKHIDSSTRIFLFSANNSLQDRMRGYASGADDYIVKPIEPEEVLAKVNAFFRHNLKVADTPQANRLAKELKLLERQISELGKLAFIGKNASEVVHILNNHLTSIQGFTEILSQRYPGDSKLLKIDQTSENMKKLINSILISTEPESSEKDFVDLLDVVKNQLELFRISSFFRYKIKYKLKLSTASNVFGSKRHFQDMVGSLIQLAVAALQNSPEKTLTINTGTEQDLAFVHVSSAQRISSISGVNDRMPKSWTHPAEDKHNAYDIWSETGKINMVWAKKLAKHYGGSIFESHDESGMPAYTLTLPTCPIASSL